MAPTLGDCIDCNLCVKVCPTGIDIRHGTQLECVNCTACIDACDEVMTKIDRPTGLIRYDSHNNIDKGVSKLFTPRVWAYSAILAVLILFQVFLLSTRTDVEIVLLRTPGMMYQELENGYISNLYNYQLINKTSKPIEDLEFKIKSMDGNIKLVGEISDIGKQDVIKGSFFIELKTVDLTNRKTKLKVEVYSDGKLIDEAKTNFLGPIK